MKATERVRDERTDAYAGEAQTLAQRIEDMESRLAVERAQASAHARAFGAQVKRRLTSPTSLIFSASVGFVAAELIGARTTIIREAQRQGTAKPPRERRSLLAGIVEPLMPLLRVGVLGFFAKKNKDIADSVEQNVGVPGDEAWQDVPPTLH